MDDAAQHLSDIVGRLDAPIEPDARLAAEIGAGDLENLVRAHGVQLWGQIEKLARTNIRFRRALRSVWAYDSPEYDRRTSLLEELGEFRHVGLSFVVESDDFDEDGALSWRAVQIEGGIPPARLAPVLRSIADWAERQGGARGR